MVRVILLFAFSTFLGAAELIWEDDVPMEAVDAEPVQQEPGVVTPVPGVLDPSTQMPPLPIPRPDPPPQFDPNYKPVGLGRSADVRCQSGYLSRSGGHYGQRGQMLIDEILNSPMKNYFFDNVALGGFCKNFQKFNKDQKLNFWVALFTHLGDFESDCRHWLYGTCTNGKCGGDFQVPEAYSRRKWRVPKEYKRAYSGKGCRGNRGNGKNGRWSSGTRNNISCAVQIMAGQLCGFYRTNRGVCTRNTSPLGRGYWQPINGGYVKARMRSFPLCKEGAQL